MNTSRIFVELDHIGRGISGLLQEELIADPSEESTSKKRVIVDLGSPPTLTDVWSQANLDHGQTVEKCTNLVEIAFNS